MDHSKEVAILDAARELTYSQGPGKVSMEAVARRAGVSKVTLYSRFPDKNALIEATIRQQLNELVENLAITPGGGQDPRHALNEFGQRLLTFVLSKDYLNFLHLLGSVPEVDRELVQGIYECGAQASRDTLSLWLSAAHDAGDLCCHDTEFAAEMFLGMLIGLDIVRSLHRQPPRRPGDSIETHVAKVVDACLILWKKID